MKRGEFTIQLESGSLVLVQGYTLIRDGIHIGIHKQKSNINSSVYWYVTELNSFKCLPYKYKTRKEALDGMDAWFYKIKEIVADFLKI